MRTSSDPLQYWHSLTVVRTIMMDWFALKGVHPLTIGSGENTPLKVAYGYCADDGLFDIDPSGDLHIAVLIEDSAGPIDVAFWHVRSGRTATLLHLGFALGEEQINNPGVCAFGGSLKVWRTPLEWLQAGRDGIVILNSTRAWYRMLHVERIEACDYRLSTHLKKLLRPPRCPEVRAPGRSIAR